VKKKMKNHTKRPNVLETPAAQALLKKAKETKTLEYVKGNRPKKTDRGGR